MTIAITRRFQNDRVSFTPRMKFIASMISTKTLDDSQRTAARPNEINPDGGSRSESRQLVRDERGGVGRQQITKRLRKIGDRLAPHLALDPGKPVGRQRDQERHERHEGGERIKGDSGRPSQDRVVH